MHLVIGLADYTDNKPVVDNKKIDSDKINSYENENFFDAMCIVMYQFYGNILR